MSIHSTYIHTPTYIHEMTAADTVDTANWTRISQRVHDQIQIFKWCMCEARSVLIIQYSTIVRKGIKKQRKLNFHPRTITCTYPPPTFNRHPLIHIYMPTYIHNHTWRYSSLLVDILPLPSFDRHPLLLTTFRHQPRITREYTSIIYIIYTFCFGRNVCARCCGPPTMQREYVLMVHQC